MSALTLAPIRLSKVYVLLLNIVLMDIHAEIYLICIFCEGLRLRSYHMHWIYQYRSFPHSNWWHRKEYL